MESESSPLPFFNQEIQPSKTTSEGLCRVITVRQNTRDCATQVEQGGATLKSEIAILKMPYL
jgi:hypothetical protein